MKVLFGEFEPAEGIAMMGIEARRNEQQIGRKIVERRKNTAAKGVFEALAPVARPQRRVENVADAGFAQSPRAGKSGI